MLHAIAPTVLQALLDGKEWEGARPGTDALAVSRFFYDTEEFGAEVALYQDPVLREVLPKIIHASENLSGAERSRSGYVFPPFMVLERGITLAAWVTERSRNFFEVSTMLESVCAMLSTLHASGRVHRDLKPDNVLYLLQTTEWRLLDLGIVADSGAQTPVSTPPPLDPEHARV